MFSRILWIFTQTGSLHSMHKYSQHLIIIRLWTPELSRVNVVSVQLFSLQLLQRLHLTVDWRGHRNTINKGIEVVLQRVSTLNVNELDRYKQFVHKMRLSHIMNILLREETLLSIEFAAAISLPFRVNMMKFLKLDSSNDKVFYHFSLQRDTFVMNLFRMITKSSNKNRFSLRKQRRSFA